MASCQTTVQDTASADTAAITQLIETTADMNNAGDAAGWAGLFAEDAVYMPGGQAAVTTPEGILEMGRLGFSHGTTDIIITPDEIIISGDWAFARSAVTGTFTGNDGESFPLDLKQIVIYQRQADGEWKIARLIGNSNQ